MNSLEKYAIHVKIEFTGLVYDLNVVVLVVRAIGRAVVNGMGLKM